MNGSRSSSPLWRRTTNLFTVVLILLLLLLGGFSVYFGWQNNSLNASNSSLQSSATSLRGNLSALSTELSNFESQHAQLLSSNTSLANKVVELNSSLLSSTQILESLHSLSNRTVIVSNEAVRVGAGNQSTSPPMASVVNFTAKYSGYVIVTVVANPNTGEMFLSVWSSPSACNGHRVFCSTGGSPNVFPGDSVLVPILAGHVQIDLGNYNNYEVNASITVVLYG